MPYITKSACFFIKSFVARNNPTSPLFANLSDNVQSVFVASSTCDISLYQNDNLVQTFSNTDSISYTFIASQYGKQWIKAIADDGFSQSADSFYFMVRPPVTIATLPTGANDGINYVSDSTATLVLVAPNKQFVYAIGDFSNWEVDDSTYLNQTPDGTRWWITLYHLIPQQEYRYQYLVDGLLKIADPYADKVLDANNDSYISSTVYPSLISYPTNLTTGIVSVLQTDQTSYTWNDAGFVKPPEDNLVIYELLIRDFIGAHSYQVMQDTLNYLKNLGVNTIELMPINEFEGNLSWGYNPSFHFAVDKYYGPKDELKAFIDLCHQNGIAVVLDVVYNHAFSQSPLCQLYWDSGNFWPAADNPWLNTDCDAGTAGYQGKHPFGVGYDFNHESLFTQKFMDDNLKYWVTEFHADGFRFDLSKGFTQTYSGNNVGQWGQYDQSRIDLLQRMANEIWDTNAATFLILEHFADNSEEKVLADFGFLLWGNLAYAYDQCAMGYASGADISWISYIARNWNYARVVGYMESHDEERMMYKTITFGNYNTSYDVRPLDSALQRVKLASCFFIPIPGPKMIWQFGELGYDYSLTYGGGNTAPKPIRWDYLNYNPRVWLYKHYAALNKLKQQYTVFRTTNFQMNVGSLYKSVRLTDAFMKVCILGNFDIVSANVTPYFQNTGWWYEYFTGDSQYVSNTSATINFQPGEYRLYTSEKLPPPDLGNVGISDAENEAALQLFNYPNPFSGQTTIDFYLPESGNATLEIFDLFGKQVKLIAEKVFAPGWYTVNLSSDNLADGIYFCSLSSEKFRRTIQIEVLR